MLGCGWARVGFGAVVVLVVCACAPGSSLGSVTIGSNLTGSVDSGGDCLGMPGPCTWINRNIEGGMVTAPVSGVVVRWRVKGSAMSGATSVTFRVVHVGADAKAVGAGSSTGMIGTTLGVYGGDTRLPIQAGDTIGLDGDFTKLTVVHLPGNSTTIVMWTPPLTDGGTPRSASTGHGGYELLLNADIATPPVTAASFIPGCPGTLRVAVTADPDPATGPKAVHFRLDGGGEQILSAANGSAAISLSAGTHTVETWGEDLLGQQEAAHHMSTVAVNCPPTPAPVLSSAHLSTSTFRAAVRGGSLTTRRRAPIGTIVSYRDSQAATTTFTVLKPLAGHKKGRRCLAGRPRRGQKRCTRYVSVGSFTHRDQAGSVRVRFTGRVRGHKLTPGPYRLTLAPTANGKTGRTVQIAFHIIT